MKTILQPTWIIDGAGAAPLTDHAVVIEGQTIVAVAPVGELQDATDATILELPQMSLLPGLVNNHVHLVLPGDGTFFLPWLETQSDAQLAMRAAYNSQVSLRAGITTVRDCGGRGNVVVDVRNAQRAGMATGARIITCGWPLTITGGHTRQFGGEVDGEEGVRRMVRRVVSQGVDYVKVMASGGGTPGSFPQYPSFSLAELRAIVEEAHRFGHKVAAHCTNAAAIQNGIDAGIDLMEHAMLEIPEAGAELNLDVIKRLADSGIAVTPTTQVNRDMVDEPPPGSDLDGWRQRQQIHRETVAYMHELGVPLLAGSDAGWRSTAFHTFWKELDELVASGLAPVAAIHAATGAISKALDQGDSWGTIQAGQVADLVVVAGNCAVDMRALTQVNLVFQAGKLMYSALMGGNNAD